MNELIDKTASVGREAQGIFAALRSELWELGRGERHRQCLMVALAVALSTTAAIMLQVDAPWWAAISAVMSTQATAPASLVRGTLRIIGTSIGAALAVLLAPRLIEDQVALSLALLAASTLGVLGLQVSKYGYAWLMGAITMAMVLLAALGDPLSTLEVACNRTAEVTIGTVAAIGMALLLAPDGQSSPANPPAPGWSDLLGAQWPSTEHALRAGVGVMLVPLVWALLELPGLSQTAITVAAVMAVPAPAAGEAMDQHMLFTRAMHRLFGCLVGGVVGLACLALSVESFPIWLLILMAGVWLATHVQGSTRGIGYVGTQAAVVFISTLVQGWGPPTSILPGIERFAGITSGLLILLAVSLLSAPSTKVRS